MIERGIWGFVTDVAGQNGDDVHGGYGFSRGQEKDAEGEKGKKKKKKEEKWGDKIRLRSEVVPNATGYYSGIVHNRTPPLNLLSVLIAYWAKGALHIHPVTKIMQMRTSLSYLDEYDTRSKERASRRERNGDNDDNDDDRPRPKPNGTAPARQIKVRTLFLPV